MTDTIAKLRDLANLLLIEGKREWSDTAEEGAEVLARLTAEVERLRAALQDMTVEAQAQYADGVHDGALPIPKPERQA